MTNSVKAALAEREKRKNTATSDKVSAALEARRKRKAEEERRDADVARGFIAMSEMTGGGVNGQRVSAPTADTEKSYSPLMVKAGQSSGIDFSSRDKSADDAAFGAAVSKIHGELDAEAKAKEEKEAAEREAIINYDTEAGKKKIEQYEDNLSDLYERQNAVDEKIASFNGTAIYDGIIEVGRTDVDERKALLNEKISMKLKDTEKGLSDKLNDERVMLKAANKSLDRFEHQATSAPDFADKSGYVSTKYDPVADRHDYLYNNEFSMGYGDLTYEYINNQNGVRDEILGHVNDGGRAYSDFGYEYMTPEQVSIYNYYYATEGREKAEQYLSLIADELTTALAWERVKAFDDTWKESFYIADASAKNAVTNMTQGFYNFLTDSEDPIVRSADYKATRLAKENDTGVRKVFNDLVDTTANQLPSIGASILANAVLPGSGGFVANATMWANNAGSGYDEMIGLGYSPSQASAYAVLTATSETALQSIMGGISAFGGGVIDDLIPGVNKAIAKLAIKHPNLAIFANVGKEMGKEALEEGLQSVLEPVFKAYATGEDFEGVDVSEVLYSALLGALSSFGLEGAPTIAVNTPGMVSNVIVGAANKRAAKGQIIKGIDNATLTKDMSRLAVDALKSGVDAVGKDSAADYAADFRSAYHAGRLGMPLGAVADSSVMSYSQRQAAYNLGMEDGKAAKSQTDGDLSAELAKDPEIAAVIKAIEAENAAQSGVRSTAGRALDTQANTPKVRAKEFLTKNGALSSEQEVNAKKAESAKTDTARTGYLSGASEIDIHIAESMAKLTGREILFAGEGYEADGEFDGKNTIIVNPKRGNVLSQIIAHELTHSIQGTKEYTSLVNNLKDFVNIYSERGMIADWDTLYSEVWKDYEKKHEELTGEKFDDAKAEKEIVARVMESFFGEGESTSERQVDLTNFIMEFTAANKNAATRIWYKLTQMAKRIREDIAHYATKKVWGENYDSSYREHQLMLRKIEDLRDQFGRALMQAKGKPGDGKRAFSFAGEKAATANKLTLENAKAMLEAGADPETVRRETGWYKGYDGKWRFEIDDSKIEIKEVHIFNYLGDMISHPELFTAYPELKDVPVSFQKLDGARGQYTRNSGYAFGDIDIDISLKNNHEELKSTLIHEIQHAIQDYEEFARGASPDYWERKSAEGYDSRTNEYRQKEKGLHEKYESIKRNKPEFFDEMEALMATRPNVPRGRLDAVTFEKIEEDPPEWKAFDAERDRLEAKYGWQDVFDFMDLKNDLDNISSKGRRTPYELYYATAGEVEARDAAKRLDLDAEQRKNTRPDNNRSDVVFAEGSAVSKNFVGWTSDGIEVYQSSKNVMGMSRDDRIAKFKNDFLANFKGKTAKFSRNGHTYYARFVETSRGAGKFTHEGNSKSDPPGYKAKVRVLANGDMINIVEDSSYKRSAKEKGKKTAAHKRAAYWDYFYKTVVIDGKGYDIVIDIRNDVINGQYNKKQPFVYSMEFYENKKVGTSLATPASSKADVNLDVPTNNSIAHPDPNVNTSGKSLSLSRANTTPQNELETKMKAQALSMYADMRKAQRAQRATDITEESIYEQTGWYFDDYGNFVVDREAPVYVKAAPVKQQRYVDNAHKRAETAEARASEAYAENAALREDVAKWKARAESAEKAARIIERDAGARIKADRQLSPEYMPSAKQVRGVVKELADMFGGGYSSKQIGEFSARLMSIYDSIGTNARYASDLTNYSKDIAELISDMQDVRLKNEDNAELAVTLRGELKTPVYLSPKARGDLNGGYGATVRKYGGRIKFTTKERGTPVDVRYGELSGAYPDWFPADITNEADQLNRMLEVSDTISDRGFASSDRYNNVGADPEAVRTKDFDRAMMRILDGYAELEAVPRTFADGLMRQLEFERRENQRELAKATDEERERLTKQHEAEIERLVQEAEAAMEWETKYLNDKLSQVYADIRAAEKKAADDAKSAREAAIQRAHARGADIQDAAIEAAQADGSFTKKMTELYERHTALEDEIARIQAECKKHDHVDLDAPMSKDERAYIKQLRARRDALIEDKSNLEAYINKVNARVKDIRFKTMCDMIAKENYLKDWKDKAAPIFHAMETMRRNVQDISPKKGDSVMAKYIIEQILDPITNATYTSTLVQNQVRGRVKELKLATKPHKGDVLSESQFVQAYGEAMDNIKALDELSGSFIYNRHGEPMREGMTADEWRGYLNRIIEENPGITKDAEKFKHMKESVKVFKDIYDDLFTIVNAARVRNGYAPVPYHRGYFPHYNNDTKQDGVFSSLLKGLGLREQEISEKLPTSINGLTATFRPGIRYMSNAKQRSMAGFEGDRRVTGAVEGLDRYIETATDVAFQTDNIQNLRSLSNAIRYATTKDETKKRVDEIRNDSSLNRDQKQERINEIFANKTDKTKYALNNFIVELEEYTNQLAGKKSARDREYESLIGRSLYTAMKKITGNTAANAIAGNIGSALTNFIPLMDGGAVMHYHMLGAMWDMMQGHIQGDSFISTSQFLTNRRGSDRLIKSGRQAASDVLGSPMNFVDNITSELLMRARVRQNMSKHRGGMSFQAAMNEADTFIAGMMGDRSKGALPTIFGAKNPVYKMFTMYQVEVKNQFGFILKDLPKDSDKGEFIVKMIAMAVLHSLFNDFYEKLVGRRPALDPLHMLNDLGGDLFGWKFEAFDEMFNGDGNIIEKTEKKGIADSVMSFFTTAASEAPFIGGLIGGGRIPISSVMPDWDYLKKAFTGFEKGDGGQKIAENFYKGVSPVIYYGVMPMAGGAVKKVVEGVNAYAKGGSYTYDAEGNRKLQYPVFTDEGAASVGTAIKSAVFGKTSTEGGRDWVESGFGTLSVKQTACYENMVKAGEGQRESWELINQLRSAGKFTGEIDILLDSDIIDEAKEVAFLTFVGTGESMPGILDELRRKKVDIDDFMKVYKVKLTASGNVKEQVLDAINALGISKEKKNAIYLSWYSEKSINDAPWNGR